MPRPTSILKCASAAIALVAASLAIASLGTRSPQELAPGPDSCGDSRKSGGVYCPDNHDPGGPIGCFRSPCEAHKVGAYHCTHIDACD